jgi:hypothetical protein
MRSLLRLRPRPRCALPVRRHRRLRASDRPRHVPAPPASWEESRPGNLAQRASALTTFNAVVWWAAWRLRIGFFFARSPLIVRLYAGRTFPALSFIHFARWALVSELPASAGGRLAQGYLLFETNFNGSFDDYIAAFSDVLWWRLSNIWGGSPGFRGPRPSGAFKEFIGRQEYEAAYYHSAYPEATATEVMRALELRARLRRFARQVEGLDQDAFAERYARFLADAQLLL